MTITKLKAKNQLTIPGVIIKRLGLKPQELFMIEVEAGYIKLTPVTVESKYSAEELQAMDDLVERELPQGKLLKPGKNFIPYLKKLSK